MYHFFVIDPDQMNRTKGGESTLRLGKHSVFANYLFQYGWFVVETYCVLDLLLNLLFCMAHYDHHNIAIKHISYFLLHYT